MTDGAESARRRGLARAISRAADAGALQALRTGVPEGTGEGAWRIGVTGAPGGGKSSLIARLAAARLAALPAGDRARLAVLAIDPASPLSQGALLGDRLRMTSVTEDPRLYVRSLSSRSGRDGLTHNIVDLLGIVDAHGFDEVILETVGIGQAEHAVRTLVDSVVLVLHPEAGDSIQAMKAGIMEIADIYVVNKADLPGTQRTLAELRATLGLRPQRDGGWSPPVLPVSHGDADSLRALDAALRAHRAHAEARRDTAALRRARRRYQLESLVLRRIAEIGATDGLSDADLPGAYAAIVAALARDLEAEAAPPRRAAPQRRGS